MLAELEIDLDAIRTNVRTLARFCSPARVAPVIKANAYGHGIVEVARALEADVERLCVYAFDEARELRAAGVTAPIHVLGPIAPDDLDAAISNDVQFTLWSEGAYFNDVIAASRRCERPATVHAKIDTGVTRLGMSTAQAPDRIARYLRDERLTVIGAFSHLAAAEELASQFTDDQRIRFETATAPFASRLERHLAASAAAMLYPATRFDLVRPGIAIYGLWPSPATRESAGNTITLKPALSWRTQLAVVHDVAAGTSVGYGCTYHTTSPSRIGVLPIGYAEGLPRAASGRAFVAIDGVRVPVVGRICMNMAFVDVTGVPKANAGSSATLIGRDGSERIGADEWAAWSDTIDYEIVARLPPDMRRRFVAGSPTL